MLVKLLWGGHLARPDVPHNHQMCCIAAQANNPKYDLKVTTTAEFEKNHIAKNEQEALKKARNRVDGGELLNYRKVLVYHRFQKL